MLAPSAAAFLAIASPIPRLAPEMNMVLPDNVSCAMGHPNPRETAFQHRVLALSVLE
jgi:hypothetical protein